MNITRENTMHNQNARVSIKQCLQMLSCTEITVESCGREENLGNKLAKRLPSSSQLIARVWEPTTCTTVGSDNKSFVQIS